MSENKYLPKHLRNALKDRQRKIDKDRSDHEPVEPLHRELLDAADTMSLSELSAKLGVHRNRLSDWLNFGVPAKDAAEVKAILGDVMGDVMGDGDLEPGNSVKEAADKLLPEVDKETAYDRHKREAAERDKEKRRKMASKAPDWYDNPKDNRHKAIRTLGEKKDRNRKGSV